MEHNPFDLEVQQPVGRSLRHHREDMAELDDLDEKVERLVADGPTEEHSWDPVELDVDDILGRDRP